MTRQPQETGRAIYLQMQTPTSSSSHPIGLPPGPPPRARPRVKDEVPQWLPITLVSLLQPTAVDNADVRFLVGGDHSCAGRACISTAQTARQRTLEIEGSTTAQGCVGRAVYAAWERTEDGDSRQR